MKMAGTPLRTRIAGPVACAALIALVAGCAGETANEPGTPAGKEAQAAAVSAPAESQPELPAGGGTTDEIEVDTRSDDEARTDAGIPERGPHEEGLDFPNGEDCPFCPFWKGKQGSKRRD